LSPRPKSYKTRKIPRKHKTTTKQGFNEYMRKYMRIRRAEQKKGVDALCKMNLQQTLGIDLKKLKRLQRPPKSSR